MTNWLDQIKWTDDGLLPTAVQDASSGKLLMLAWMNRESLQQTVATGNAVFWSRSRQKLWRKGEVSGHVQKIKSICLDCDGDTLVLKVDQIGGIACHTGRNSCFYRELKNEEWHEIEPVLQSPESIYGDKS